MKPERCCITKEKQQSFDAQLSHIFCCFAVLLDDLSNRSHGEFGINLQYILGGSWSPSLSVADMVAESSDASGSTCPQ